MEGAKRRCCGRIGSVSLLFLLLPVLASLPAPVNVTVSSVNFQHELRWDPGPGTPPGARYHVRQCQRKRCHPRNSTSPSMKLKLKDPRAKYCLSVQASHKHSLSPESRRVTFSPFQDTIIGPPKLFLAGCGSCIQINISLPEVSKSTEIHDIQSFYNADFRVLWRKREGAVMAFLTKQRSFTLDNLENGMEYCVQVHIKMNLNKNSVPSAWKCIFSSTVEPSRVPLISGTVSVLLIFVVGGLMTFMYCLYTTGFLCKLKALPRALIEVLSPGPTLTPEKTTFDHLVISRTLPQPATRATNSEDEDEEQEEEEEEGEINVYMNRVTELSLGGSSCQESGGVLDNRTEAASGTEEKEAPHTESEEDDDGPHQDASKDERRGQKDEEEKEEEEEEEEVCDSSGNVNLLSVTLAALSVCEEEEEEEEGEGEGEGEGEEEEEEEEEDSSTDCLDLEPLLSTDSQQTLRPTDLQTGSVALVLPEQEDCNGSEYEGTHWLTACDEEAGTDEEVEEFSEYMRHT